MVGDSGGVHSHVPNIRAAKTQPPEKNGRGVEPPLGAPNPPLPPLNFGAWRWTRTKVWGRGIWGVGVVGGGERGAGGAERSEGGVGSVWEGEREGGRDGGSERRRKNTIPGQIILNRI